MIVVHVAITTAEQYVVKREPHRRAHIERLAGLRAGGVVIGGGPALDSRSVDLVYRLGQADQLAPLVEEDPYWTAGAWTRYVPRSFAEFIEPWELPAIVLDGSRPATIVEGRTAEHDMAQFALIELRGAGRLAFGGFFPDGDTFALCRTADAAQAAEWFASAGFWAPESLHTRGLLHVL
ncbi:MAG: YciI family protein [Candidatus Rokuibacteriota bacterium]